MKQYSQKCPAGHREMLPWNTAVTAWCDQCKAGVAFDPLPVARPGPASAEEMADITAHVANRFREFTDTMAAQKEGRKVELEAKGGNEDERLTIARMRQGGFPERHIAAFKNMDNPGKERARRLHDMLHGKPGPAGVLLWGAFGTGKTQIAVAAAMMRAFKGEYPRYVHALELIRGLRDNMRTNTPDTVFLRRYHECRFLVLDEIHSALDDHPDSANWARTQIQSILDTRYRSNKSLKTVMIANADGLTHLNSRIGGNILSRITEDGAVMQCDGGYYRKGAK